MGIIQRPRHTDTDWLAKGPIGPYVDAFKQHLTEREYAAHTFASYVVDITPWKSTVLEIRAWLRLNPSLRGKSTLVPNRDGQAMSRSNVAQRLALAAGRAAVAQPSLLKNRVSPHTLRHTSAMHLLQSGVRFNVIALWLGHESRTTTHRYVEADLAMKEKALARLQAPDTKMGRYKAPDSLMRFLQTL